ncbi:hypothetical protein V495_07040 [Pseudogymnoascus sp. VKM F-4514 (FW-929)]|nr:hypothetical protein V495_07040 [Pseudogymnoascus sp. VKM F-4514 (FW-929)]KFY61400.1 hypothetical protein V497_02980 [Pseudogymnoascus sp. VKM F-4516 (FW-969)]
MLSRRYAHFFLFGIALFITHASASAPSNDTSTDDKVSCVYPISGVYGLLSRVLFYSSLIFAVLGQRFEWLVIGALASAMTFSATTAIHIIIIFATHGRHPPILDLDAVSIALMAIASVSMFPALICFSSAFQKNRAGRVVITIWFFTMVIAYVLALLVLFDTAAQHSNVAVPCFFPDKTLLTSLAQLDGTRDLECIYDCFLTRGSILKPQDAAMVMWGSPMHGALGTWSMIVSVLISSLMIYFGSFLAFTCWKTPFSEKRDKASDKPQIRFGYGTGSDKDGYRMVERFVIIGSVLWAPVVLLVEISMRNIPIEENFNAIGQWGSWVAALFAIIGSVIYHFFEPADSHEHRKTPEASSDDGFASTRSDGSCTPPSSQRRSSEEEIARHGCTPDAAAGRIGVVPARDLTAYTPRWERRCPERRLASGGNSATDMRDEEADIGGYGIPLADRGQ